MHLDKAINEALQNILPMFGIAFEYQGAADESYLSSASQVNILIGLTNGIKGNIAFGFNKAVAMKIVSSMMGGALIADLDVMAESALGELANMIVGSMSGKLSSEKLIEYSPPTLVIGDRMFLVISRVRSRKVTYRVNSELFNISFCTE
jgi:Predicted inhibitor of MCP methylation, homolog of CheC